LTKDCEKDEKDNAWRPASAATSVALLRGVNVGGRNTIAMRDLVALFAEAGCDNVRTHIQSGNVLFTASPDCADDLPESVAKRIAERFGYRTTVVARTADQLAEIVANNPFLAAGADEDSLHVMFLSDTPDPRRVAALDPERSPPDEFVVRGREIYLRLPNGAGRSRLTNAYFDAKLASTSTLRNWRTVTKLLALAKG
jgi:uncharacterized protein (DUF1697 family)